MLQSRRSFIGALSLPALALTSSSHALGFNKPRVARWRMPQTSPDPIIAAQDEAFWFAISQAFSIDRSIINLNNGGVSPSPTTVLDAMQRHLAFSNQAPPYTMWRVLEPQQEAVRIKMARQWDVDPEEIAFTRNASEGLQICQFGFDLKPGDEVLTTDQDYPRMINTFLQRQRREGLVLKQFALPVPSTDPREIVRLFVENVSPKTRLVLMCHTINLTGQILPVREVCSAMRDMGIPVIVDGAHALAHFDFKLSDLNCDYYATSLHKWLFAPHGTGLLYVRRNKIKDLWPLMAAPQEQQDDIRKFEQIGTHPAANHLAISEALAFHQGIGPARKQQRLIHLRDYWARKLLENDRVSLHTSLAAGDACGIATVQIKDIDSSRLNNWLWKTRRILTTAINHSQFQGVRVSPSVYTTHHDLDQFIDAMQFAIDNGLPT